MEYWLNNVLVQHCDTVRDKIHAALKGYEEKSRDQWIFDFPAQATLTANQIWWSVEVEMAFARLEEGYETALKDYNKKQVVQVLCLVIVCNISLVLCSE